MANKTVISLNLSEAGIDKAIEDLEQYKAELLKKSELLQKRVAEYIQKAARNGFGGAVAEDILNGDTKTADVKVTKDERGDATVVVASGADAIWVEFGAGVYYNGGAGGSPHPRGSELGMLIGEYGYGLGKRRVWGYYDGDELVLTHGTPAAMPMEKAFLSAYADLYEIAREVFG